MWKSIVAATDGLEASLGALRTARHLAQRADVPVTVVAVAEPFPLQTGVGESTLALSWKALQTTSEEELRDRVQKQLADIPAADAEARVAVETGLPARSIVRIAAETGAGLIVLGLGRHALADRWFGTETALRAMRLAHVPVLAVPAGAHGVFRRAVVATDFSAYSEDAAQSAAQLLEPGAELHLVHVVWSSYHALPAMQDGEWLVQYEEVAGRRLEELTQSIASNTGLRVESHLLQGNPAREAQRLVDRLEADLLAAGSHGLGFVSRILFGSVSTRLVRGSSGAVLITPPRDVPPEVRMHPTQTSG